MTTVLVTGATGILGSSVCELLEGRGDRVRALVRRVDSVDARALAAAGVEVVAGDVTDRASVDAATQGAEAVVHSAAVLGRPGVTLEDCFAANVMGTIHVLTAAASFGNIPVVQVLTSTFFDRGSGPFTEHSPFDLLFRHGDVYSLTKRLAYAEGFARVAEGQDIRFMCPGAMYGPSICIEKTAQPNSFNGRLARAIRGEMPPQLPMTVSYVWTEDCARVCIGALDKGRAGERFICQGDPADSATIAENCNRACEIAGVPHRVSEIPRDQLDSPEVIAQFGTTMPALAKHKPAGPGVDDSITRQKLGTALTSTGVGFPKTIDWFRANGFI
ncbi:MAG TPA: NAD-dependent epimerase/dehydratase family protein [Novosphingobium sp.]|nr:NAD-dependent epimerase/dehydratase family protein [Novosphingobium sp.]